MVVLAAGSDNYANEPNNAPKLNATKTYYDCTLETVADEPCKITFVYYTTATENGRLYLNIYTSDVPCQHLGTSSTIVSSPFSDAE